MRPGLPPCWEELAIGLRASTGRELRLQPSGEPFWLGPEVVDVRLDGVLLGQFAFWWDAADLEDTLAELRTALGVYLDEELGTENW